MTCLWRQDAQSLLVNPQSLLTPKCWFTLWKGLQFQVKVFSKFLNYFLFQSCLNLTNSKLLSGSNLLDSKSLKNSFFSPSFFPLFLTFFLTLSFLLSCVLPLYFIFLSFFLKSFIRLGPDFSVDYDPILFRHPFLL